MSPLDLAGNLSGEFRASLEPWGVAVEKDPLFLDAFIPLMGSWGHLVADSVEAAQEDHALALIKILFSTSPQMPPL